jgi:hypothetical protein
MRENSAKDTSTSTGQRVIAGIVPGRYFAASALFFRTHASYSLRGMKRSEAELMQ